MTAPAMHTVTATELVMLQLIAAGLTVQQIARRTDSTTSAVATPRETAVITSARR